MPPKQRTSKTDNLTRGNWPDERVAHVRKYLRDPSSDPDLVKRQLDYYKNFTFKLRSNRVIARRTTDGSEKELLGDDQVVNLVKQLYAKSDDSVGKVPKMYKTLSKQYWNVSWPKVQKAVESLPNY